MKIYQRDNSTKTSVFVSMFIMSSLIPLFSIFAPLSVKYGDPDKNSLQWKGFWLGQITSIFLYLSINFLMSSKILLKILAIILLIFDLAYFVVILYNKNRFVNDPLAKSINEVKQNLKDPNYNKRYALEYKYIRYLAINNDKEFYEQISNEGGKDLLFKLYNKIKEYNIDDFDIANFTYKNYNIYVLKLPNTEVIPLANMIGIIKNQDEIKFFAATVNNITQWYDDNRRAYFMKTAKTIDEFNEFLKFYVDKTIDTTNEMV